MVDRVTGLVVRLSVRSATTYIRLDIDPKVSPSSGYFELKMDNKNYNALYSLALTAAANRLPLTIKTVDAIVDTKTAVVQYLGIDWESGQDDD